MVRVMFPAGGGAGAAASDGGTSLLRKEPPQNVFQHPGDVVLVIVVRKAAARRNRANRENRPARCRLEMHDVGADQCLRPLACHRRDMGQQFLGHHDVMALMASERARINASGGVPSSKSALTSSKPAAPPWDNPKSPRISSSIPSKIHAARAS